MHFNPLFHEGLYSVVDLNWLKWMDDWNWMNDEEEKRNKNSFNSWSVRTHDSQTHSFKGFLASIINTRNALPSLSPMVVSLCPLHRWILYHRGFYFQRDLVGFVFPGLQWKVLMTFVAHLPRCLLQKSYDVLQDTVIGPKSHFRLWSKKSVQCTQTDSAVLQQNSK